MEHQTGHAEMNERLSDELTLFAFGLLDDDQATQLSQHLDAGCSVCNKEYQAVSSVVVELSSAIEVFAPPADLKERVLRRIQDEKPRSATPVEECEPGIFVVRSASGNWRNTPWEGISWMKLYHDKETGSSTSLIRVEPGGKYPAHRHTGVEQSWVVEGSCRIGSVTIRAGDFACAAAGTEHSVLVSDEGCVLLVVASARDEIMA